MKLWKIHSKKYQLGNPNHLVTIKKHQLLLTDIGGAWYLMQLEAWDNFLLIWKNKYYLPVWGNLVDVFNLTDVICSVALNGVKWVVVDVEWTL